MLNLIKEAKSKIENIKIDTNETYAKEAFELEAIEIVEAIADRENLSDSKFDILKIKMSIYFNI